MSRYSRRLMSIAGRVCRRAGGRDLAPVGQWRDAEELRNPLVPRLRRGLAAARCQQRARGRRRLPGTAFAGDKVQSGPPTAVTAS